MYSFPSFEPVCCFISSSNCYFLICIQVSQETGKVVWYSHLLKNFPKFVKGFSIVDEAEVGFFSGIPLISLWSSECWQFDLWFPLHFLNPAYTSGSSRFMHCWSLAWRILSMTLLAYEMSTVVQWLEHSWALPFFGIHVYSSFIHSCQDLEATLSFRRWLVEHSVHSDNRVLLMQKRIEFLSHEKTRISLKRILLCERSKSEKATHWLQFYEFLGNGKLWRQCKD